VSCGWWWVFSYLASALLDPLLPSCIQLLSCLCSMFSSLSILSSCSSALPAANFSLSRCSITVFELAVAVVGSSSGWVGIGVDGVMTWCASATRLSHSGVAVVL
jgi:hypothetical protein